MDITYHICLCTYTVADPGIYWIIDSVLTLWCNFFSCTLYNPEYQEINLILTTLSFSCECIIEKVSGSSFGADGVEYRMFFTILQLTVVVKRYITWVQIWFLGCGGPEIHFGWTNWLLLPLIWNKAEWILNWGGSSTLPRWKVSVAW